MPALPVAGEYRSLLGGRPDPSAGRPRVKGGGGTSDGRNAMPRRKLALLADGRRVPGGAGARSSLKRPRSYDRTAARDLRQRMGQAPVAPTAASVPAPCENRSDG